MPQVDLQTRLLHGLSVHERLALAERIRVAAWELRESVLRRQHPDWSEAQVTSAVRVAFASLK
jgi:hypothetical protein